jgi:hypothetical protein
VETESGLRAGAPHVVFDSPTFTGLDQGTSFDVAPDGRILVRMLPEDPNRSREIVVVQNWFEEVKRPAP